MPPTAPQEGNPVRPGGLRFLLQALMVYRVLAVTLFLGVAAVAQAQGTRLLFFAPLPLLYGLIAFVYALTIPLAAFFPRVRDERRFGHLNLVLDLFLATIIVFLTGVHESPFSFLYLIAIVWAAVAFPGGESFLAASLASILFGGMADLAFYGLLLPPYAEEYRLVVGGSAWYVTGRVVVQILAFFAVAFLGRAMARRLRTAEEALSARTVDLLRLRRLSELVFDSVGSGILVLDGEGRVSSLNGAAASMLKVDRFALLGRPAADLLGEVPLGDLLPRAANARVDRWEGKARDREGKERTWGLSISSLRDPKREESGFVVIFSDLTLLREMEERLRRAEKFSALGRMAASLAHEVRNPLASMSGSIQLLRQVPGLGEEDERLMRIVLRETERMDALIGDFLTYARPPSPRWEEQDLRSQVADILRLLEAGAPGGGRFRLQAPAEPVLAEVDGSFLRQVLHNLLKNAAEASPSEAEVEVVVAPGKVRNHIEGVEISVADRGEGIPPEVLPEIFEPFRTSKPHGTGLGLAVVYQLVSTLGGVIDVGSRPGGGTVFTVFIPRRRNA